MNEAAEDLAFGLSHVVHLFHPAVIIIGGGLSGIGEPIRLAVQNALAHFVMEAFAPGPSVKFAKLGEDAVPVGALELARDRWGERPREPSIEVAFYADIRPLNFYPDVDETVDSRLHQGSKGRHDSISIDGVAQLIEKLRDALKEDRQIFVFGNGGSAANASHFATDLGKEAPPTRSASAFTSCYLIE